jgi:hypothetical protein
VVVALIGAALALAPGAAGAETLARWQFDEGAGQSVADASGHGRAGQLGSGAGDDPSDPTWIPGRIGHALRFDGARDEYVTISGASSIAPARITVSGWVRRLGSPGTYRYVISNGASGCDQSAYGLYSGAGGGLTFYVSGTRGYVLSPAAGADRVWDGTWHLATGTYDGSAVRLFLDGVQVGSPIATALTIDYPAGGAAYVGTFRGNCDLPFTGDVDDLSISDGALDGTAIAQIVTAAPPPPAQVAPIGAGAASTGPAGGSSTGAAGSKPAPATAPATGTATKLSCATIKVSRRSIRVGRRTTVTVTVRVGRALAGRRTVTVSGGGVQASARTGRKTGRATLSLRPRRKGTLRVALKGQARACAAPTIATR